MIQFVLHKFVLAVDMINFVLHNFSAVCLYYTIFLHSYNTGCLCDAICIQLFYCSLLLWCSLYSTHLVLSFDVIQLFCTLLFLSLYEMTFALHNIMPFVKMMWLVLHTTRAVSYCIAGWISHIQPFLHVMPFVMHSFSSVCWCDSNVLHKYSAVCWFDTVCFAQILFRLFCVAVSISHLVTFVDMMQYLHTFSAVCWCDAFHISHFLPSNIMMQVEIQNLMLSVDMMQVVLHIIIFLLIWCWLFAHI